MAAAAIRHIEHTFTSNPFKYGEKSHWGQNLLRVFSGKNTFLYTRRGEEVFRAEWIGRDFGLGIYPVRNRNEASFIDANFEKIPVVDAAGIPVDIDWNYSFENGAAAVREKASDGLGNYGFVTYDEPNRRLILVTGFVFKDACTTGGEHRFSIPMKGDNTVLGWFDPPSNTLNIPLSRKGKTPNSVRKLEFPFGATSRDGKLALCDQKGYLYTGYIFDRIHQKDESILLKGDLFSGKLVIRRDEPIFQATSWPGKP